MAHYIDKDALVAEIKKLKAELPKNRDYKRNAYNHVLHIIDTLEVKEVQEETVSEDLEEAAYHNCIDRLSKESIEDFKAGAKWQKEKDYRDGLDNDNFLTFAYMDGMEEGKKEMREQMMKDAIGCQVEEGGMCPAMESIPVLTNTDMIQLPKDKFEVGDKVKLIIIKQEEK